MAILQHELSLIVSCLVCFITGFNVDTDNALVHTGEAGSKFGFTVAQQVDQGRRWLLVGAPEMQTTQPDIIKGGAVLKCGLSRRRGCQIMPFDMSGNHRPWNGFGNFQIENKTAQWFGASLSASSRNGVVAACATRYVYFTSLYNRREPIGDCYVMNRDSQVTRYRPCKTGGTGHHRMGYCQSGFSSALTSDGSTLVMGGVGSFYWQGQLFAQNLSDRYDYEETLQLRPAEKHDDSYRGYSVATGEFSGDRKPDYVTGVPRGAALKGTVSIYNKTFYELHMLNGEQVGEYFGYSVAVSDFNGDGRDDVAVGAPFYSLKDTRTFEIGRVFVYHQARNKRMENKTIIYGTKKSKSRFGLALSAIGDINNDQFKDLAVGAPYDGDDGNGAVYIFHGSENGIIAKYSQVVYASDLRGYLSGFGFSLSGGKDMDNNLYPDILVGAYTSDKSVLLFSRPVVIINMNMTTTPEIFDLDTKACRINETVSYTCFILETCMSYSGLKVPGDIKLKRHWLLESSKNLSQRVSFMHSSTQITMDDTISLSKGRGICFEAKVYLKDEIKDKLSPIDIKLNYTMLDPPFTRGRLQPILDQFEDTTVTAQANIKKECGDDHICVPDLVVFASSEATSYVLGTTADMIIKIRVRNLGEGAFGAQLHIDLPAGVDYMSIQNIGRQPITEYIQDEHITCDIGNPLKSRGEVDLLLTTRATKLGINGTSDFLTFVMHVNSSNEELRVAEEDNMATIIIPVQAVATIRVGGSSEPEQLLYNSTTLSEKMLNKDDDPDLVHLYEILNDGPGAIELTQTDIYWPLTTRNGRYLLYLEDLPQVVRGEGYCEGELRYRKNITFQRRMNDQKETETSYNLIEQERSKRQLSFFDEDKTMKVNCSEDRANCVRYTCYTGRMEDGDSVLIRIHSRLSLKSAIKLQEEFLSIQAISSAVSQVKQLPYEVIPNTYHSASNYVETMIAAIDAGPGRQKVDFWVIVVAIVGGCLLLLLLIILLWRCGFFRRAKVEDKEYLWRAELKKNNVKYDSVPTGDS